MNQQFQSSVTVALLFAACSLPALHAVGKAEAVTPGSPTSQTAEKKVSSPTHQRSTAPTVVANADPAGKEAVKVGEYQSSPTTSAKDAVVAKVQAHEIAGRSAATLYVRNIPVLTFLGANASAGEDVKMGTIAEPSKRLTMNEGVKVAAQTSNDSGQAGMLATANVAIADPVTRATNVAAQLNQLSRDGLDAKEITVSWGKELNQTGAAGDRYLIKVGSSPLAVLDDETILPDTTRDAAKDALQATNRLRRLLGSAPPLKDITGRPVRRAQTIAFGSVKLQIRGWASWYGPGFNGNRSASGEIFNQNAMTAAHRNLPFGTKVRVTNLDNGRSVVVRINDRGPYAYDRVIDLSAGAAQVLGLINSGVAPVRLEVLGDTQTLSSTN